MAIERLERLTQQYDTALIFISCRVVFLRRYAVRFPEYRTITILPFTDTQVKTYLRQAGHSDDDIGELLRRMTSLGHQMLVVQIPRYLSYLTQFISEKGAVAASNLSRNQLFEYFIYSKLNLEDSKLNEDKRAIVKRVLEALALTMEIYQTNVITQDELMTFFDVNRPGFPGDLRV